MVFALGAQKPNGMVVVYTQPIPQGFPDTFQSWFLRTQRKNQMVVESGIKDQVSAVPTADQIIAGGTPRGKREQLRLPASRSSSSWVGRWGSRRPTTRISPTRTNELHRKEPETSSAFLGHARSSGSRTAQVYPERLARCLVCWESIPDGLPRGGFVARGGGVKLRAVPDGRPA